MKTKTELLNDLFKEWENAYQPYKGKFTYDGINNEQIYNGLKAKKNAVLFIAKEPNDIEQWGGNFPNWWKDKLQGNFSRRLGEWCYGLTNNFPLLNEATINAHRGVLSVAFMNLKKIGGGANADKEKIMKIVGETSDYLKKEIAIIEPDIIVGGGVYPEAWDMLFGKLNWINTGTGIRVAKWNNVKIIKFYHPSSRFKKADSYHLLENSVNSEVFKNL